MFTMVDQVKVEFAGEGAGEGELSWGQRDIWLAMVRQQSWLPNGAWGPLPAGTTIDDVADRLRRMMSRFPTCRTRLRFAVEGQPSQVVFGSGTTTLEVFDAGDSDPAQLAEAIRLHYQNSPFDFTTDWPLRMGVIRHHGSLTHLVVVMCHLIADGLGTQVLLDELDANLTTPIPEMQPLAQAQWQASPAGVRQNANALRHWGQILRTMPARRFPSSTDPRSPRHWRGEFTGYALPQAVQAVAARTGAGSAPTMLAFFAVALARVTGVNPVVVRPMVNNRFRPGLGRVVCMLAQYGLCSLDVAGRSLGAVVEQARAASLTTYKNAYYDPAQLDELIAHITAERGSDFEMPCYFNDRRGMTEPETPSVAPSAQQLHAAAARSDFAWSVRQDVPFEPLIVHFDEVADAIKGIIFFDTQVISPADAEALLRGLENVAVEAALDLAAPTGVPLIGH